MSGWEDVTKGIVFPWHCDQYGHMNVRWYSHAFDDASFLSWSTLGLDMNALHAAGTHTAVARACIEFRQEMRAGTAYVVAGRFPGIGRTSVNLELRMADVASGAVYATQESVLVFCDARQRRPVPVPETVRACLLQAGAVERSR